MNLSAFCVVLRLAFVFRHSGPAEVAQGQNQTGKLPDSRIDGAKPRRNEGRLTYAPLHSAHNKLTAAPCVTHATFLNTVQLFNPRKMLLQTDQQLVIMKAI